ncbi:Protein diaphanous 1 [Irineochytrium annulatum]|nr:Protein diaphanous 1 [Irineochytrium annulatum]
MWLRPSRSSSLVSLCSDPATPPISEGGVDPLEVRFDELGVFKDVETLFTSRPAKALAAAAAEKAPAGGSGAGSGGAAETVKEVAIIDSKKAQNLMTVLWKFRSMSTAELCGAIMRVDENVLTDSIVDQFIGFSPTPDELGKIKRKDEILQSIKFKLSFAERSKSFDNEITTAIAALKAIQESDRFTEVLRLILTVGNFMNSGSFMGSVYGFKITSINKIGDVKSTNGRSNLLHFIANLVETKFSDVGAFAAELKPIKAAARMNADVLKSDLRSLRKDLDAVGVLVDDLRSPKDDSDPKTRESFLRVMEPFFERASKSAADLEHQLKKMEARYRETAEKFGEDAGKMKLEDFFAIFNTFVLNYEAAILDNATERERQAVIERRKKLQEERESQRQARASKTLAMKKAEPSDNMMDDILDSLKRGSLMLDVSQPALHAAASAASPSVASSAATLLNAEFDEGTRKFGSELGRYRRAGEGKGTGGPRVRERSGGSGGRKVSERSIGARALELLGRLKEDGGIGA